MEKKKYKKSASKELSNDEQQVYTDLEKECVRWQFKNPNRKVMASGSIITNEDLLKNQKLADYLLSLGLSDLLEEVSI